MFKPVYQKNNQIWAYSFFGGDSILPSLSLLSDALLTYRKCDFCGRKNILYQGFEQTKSIRNEIQTAINIGAYPVSEVWELQSSVLSIMKDINITKDSYNGITYTILSKRMFDLIKTQMPKIEKTCVPIFEGHWKPSTEGDRIVLESE